MKDDGGPAFPITEETCAGDFKGISKRDWFAAHAMRALLPTYEEMPGADSPSFRREQFVEIARWSYEIAEAMLEERAL